MATECSQSSFVFQALGRREVMATGQSHLKSAEPIWRGWNAGWAGSECFAPIAATLDTSMKNVVGNQDAIALVMATR